MMNLSGYAGLDYFESKDLQGLKDQLSQIKLPYEIVAMYYADKKHVAWLNLSRPVKKIKKQE
jgi:hypothetical protein